MDYFTNKEINGLKADIKASEIALNAEKIYFEKKLNESIGPQMLEELSKAKSNDNNTTTKKKRSKLFGLFDVFKMK